MLGGWCPTCPYSRCAAWSKINLNDSTFVHTRDAPQTTVVTVQGLASRQHIQPHADTLLSHTYVTHPQHLLQAAELAWHPHMAIPSIFLFHMRSQDASAFCLFTRTHVSVPFATKQREPCAFHAGGACDTGCAPHTSGEPPSHTLTCFMQRADLVLRNCCNFSACCCHTLVLLYPSHAAAHTDLFVQPTRNTLKLQKHCCSLDCTIRNDYY